MKPIEVPDHLSHLLEEDDDDYNYYNDQFHLGNNTYSCRDFLFSEFKYAPSRRFLFYSSGSKLNNIIKFINEFQVRSKIPVKFRCKVFKTNKKNVIGIKLNSFWRSYFRFSLLTAVIRTGIDFNRSFNRAIEESKYFQDSSGSKIALLRFMNGYHYVKYKCPSFFYEGDSLFEGWVSYFNKINKNKINNVLVKKRKKL